MGIIGQGGDQGGKEGDLRVVLAVVAPPISFPLSNPQSAFKGPLYFKGPLICASYIGGADPSNPRGWQGLLQDKGVPLLQ